MNSEKKKNNWEKPWIHDAIKLRDKKPEESLDAMFDLYQFAEKLKEWGAIEEICGMTIRDFRNIDMEELEQKCKELGTYDEFQEIKEGLDKYLGWIEG
ncbi:MAG: hypothetical protein KKB24_00660 [Candidatus Altiarchaeota archaeon]|nr:hypothetical protein [Candidatus Altiarchaeota archaeon]MBU4406078.1 hypothetical protein [Candidatus Altiarchaeota archaeon]